MAWLIGHRSKVKGALDKQQAILNNAPGQIARYQAELDALDAVIPLHEVLVDPKTIVGTRPRRKNSMPRGNMKRHILNYLRSADRPLYTHDIALHVAKLENIDLETFPRTRFMKLISYRLKGMTAEGSVQRHHPEQTSKMGRWSLRSD
ncbi:MAG: hypothetical protein K2Q97_17595 [Burkholderiaceae bacterium]|nr:hypothetical protein [Burkholderiaceae bacterium]